MLRRASASLALLLTLLSILCWVSYRRDQARLGAIAREITAGVSAPEDRALELLHWVYQNQGFAKNEDYFLWKELRATPVDVLEEGGDCADKSRLLSSMLREIEIPSTLAMCVNDHGRPTHTIVEAEVRPGKYMVLDPIWDLYFPKEQPDEYYSLLDLRREPAILWRRLDEVTRAAPPNHKAHLYRASDGYDRATTINWEKNDLLRSLRDRMAVEAGDEVYRTPRPLILEEPKLFFAFGLALAALLLMVLYGAATVLARRRRIVPEGA